MEESKVNNLLQKRGIDRKFAKLLLIFTGGDEEAAMKIIDSIDKDILVIKAKSVCNLNNIYCDFILFYNKKSNTLEESSYYLITKDSKAMDVNIKQEYNDYLSELNRVRKEVITEKKLEKELHDFINEYYLNTGQLKIFQGDYLDRKALEKQILLFSTILEKFFGDTNVLIKMETQNIDIFEMTKTKDKYFDDEMQLAEKEENSEDSISDEEKELEIIQLECEPAYSPVKGGVISSYSIDDSIRVKIIDDREIGRYLVKLMDGIDDNGVPKPILAKIKSKEHLDKELLKIIVEFGPGITGKLVCGSDVKVEGEYSNFPLSSNKYRRKKEGKKGPLFSSTFIFLAIIMLVVAIIILILMS